MSQDTHADTDHFLSCRGLVKRFGPVTAVDGLNLDVDRGHTYALLGPSGCGKTTFLRLVSGFERPDEGLVEIDGRIFNDGRTFVPPEKRKIGMVFQDYALFPHLSVGSNIAFGIRGGSDRQGRVEQLLEVVGLAGLASRMPHELSGGQQQRVALARALAVEPDLVLLDEPFSNLDPAMRARVRTEVRQIIEWLNITAVFVTHDQEEALSVAGRVAVMMDGKILQVGPPGEIYRRPESRPVAEFLGEANFLPGKVKAGVVNLEVGRTIVDGSADGEVDVMIRPEDLILTTEAGAAVEVLSSEYYGHDQMVSVRLESGNELKVRLQASGDFEPGQRLGVRLRGDVVVYPRTV